MLCGWGLRYWLCMEGVLCLPLGVCDLTWMILLKVFGLLPDLESMVEMVGSLAECYRRLGDTFCSLRTCFYDGIGNNPNWCLVRLEGWCMMHFEYLSNDGLTVSGNRLRRVRDVDMKHDFAFVVRTLSFPLFFLYKYSSSVFRNGAIFIVWLSSVFLSSSFYLYWFIMTGI